MLIGQDRCWGKDSALLSGEYALHGCTEGHLGLSESNVAAEQALHGTGTLHIGLDLGNGCELVLGLHIGEAVLEIMLDLVVGVEGEALALLTLGVQGDELLGHILHGTLDVAAGLLPVVGGELVQLHAAVVTGADVLRHHVQLSYRDVELVGAGVLDRDVVLGHAVEFQLADPDESADTVGGVNDQVSLGDVGKAADLLGLGLLFAAGLADGVKGSSLSNEDCLDLRELKASAETARHEYRSSGGELGAVPCQRAGDTAFLDVLLDNGEGLVASGADDHGISTGTEVRQILGELRKLAAPACGLHGLKADQSAEIHPVAALQKGAHVDADLLCGDILDHGELQHIALKPLAELTLLQKDLHVLGVAGHDGVCVGEDVRMIAVEHVSGYIVENSSGLAVDQGSILLAVDKDLACTEPSHVSAQVLTDLLHVLAPDLLHESLDLVCQFLAVVEDFAGRRDQDAVQVLVEAPLRVRVEFSHSLHLVAEELGTDRPVSLNWENVQDIASNGELRSALHLLAALIAASGELCCELPQIDLLTHLQLKACGGEHARRDNGLHNSLDASADH